jgi:hypothetical protein
VYNFRNLGLGILSVTSPPKRHQKFLFLGFIGEARVHIQIEVPSLPVSISWLNLLGVKNWKIEAFKMCTKSSQTLNLEIKIFTTPSKYSLPPLPSAAVARGEKIGG